MLTILVSFFFLMLMNLCTVFSFRDQSLGRLLLLKFDKIIHIISIVFLAANSLGKEDGCQVLMSCKLVLINKQKVTFLCTNVHVKCDTDPIDLKFVRDHEWKISECLTWGFKLKFSFWFLWCHYSVSKSFLNLFPWELWSRIGLVRFERSRLVQSQITNAIFWTE